MAEQDQQKQQKQKQPQQQQKPQQKPGKHNLTGVEKEEEPTIVFERPTPHGWYTVVFPKVHDQNTILELWLDQVHEWFKLRDIKQKFWCFAHGVEKKEMNRISPVFFFKDEMDAASMMWRFNGELLK